MVANEDSGGRDCVKVLHVEMSEHKWISSDGRAGSLPTRATHAC